MKLYQELAADLSTLIRQGTLQTGDRIPSVRELCRERGVSPATAMRAYDELEASGLVESRHRSGYYVSNRWQRAVPEPRPSRPSSRSTQVDVSNLVFEILEASRHRDVVPLGSAFPSPTLFPWAKLARHLGSSARSMDPWSTVESLPPGSDELRRQIARRYLHFGSRVTAEEIIVTSGALEALKAAADDNESDSKESSDAVRQRAAQALLLGGYVHEGIAGVRDVLSQVGLRLAPTPRRA